MKILFRVWLTTTIKKRTSWELVLLLEDQGWTNAALGRKKPPSYIVGSAKVWYYSKSVLHGYLLALLQAEDLAVPIPHGRGAPVYKALLEGKKWMSSSHKRQRHSAGALDSDVVRPKSVLQLQQSDVEPSVPPRQRAHAKAKPRPKAKAKHRLRAVKHRVKRGGQGKAVSVSGADTVVQAEVEAPVPLLAEPGHVLRPSVAHNVKTPKHLSVLIQYVCVSSLSTC